MNYVDFEKTIKSLGCKPNFINKLAFTGISTMIAEDETIKGVSNCIDSDGAGAIIVTNKNFYSFKLMGILKSESKSIPINKISSYSISGGLTKDLIISEGTSQYIYKTVSNYESILTAIKNEKSNNLEVSNIQPPIEKETDIAVELRKFKSLLDEGLITQEDFDKKKAALLGI